MRIGPLLIKLKPLIVILPIFGIPNYFYRKNRYENCKKIFQQQEQQQVINAQAAQLQIDENTYPSNYLNSKGESVNLNDLEGEIKILIFGNHLLYQRYITYLRDNLRQFKIQYYNVSPLNDKIIENHYRSAETIKPQLIVLYQDQLIYIEEINQISDPLKSSQFIQIKINKYIDKLFLQQLKF